MSGVVALVLAVALLAPPKPHIVWKPIPFGAKRKAEMAQYAERHYGIHSYVLHPKVIVEHVTATSTFSSAYNTFAADVPDAELHSLPGTCAHFIVDRDGTIYQLVPLDIMCRHTVGLNYVAIGIEHVGLSDAQVLGDAAQMRVVARAHRVADGALPDLARERDRPQREPLEPVPQGAVRSLAPPNPRRLAAPDMNVYRTRLAALLSR